MPRILTLPPCFLLASYLVFRSVSPPHSTPSPPTTASLPKDALGISPRGIQIRRFTTLALWLLHTLIATSYPSPPHALCPNPSNLSPTLFTWSRLTATLLLIVIPAAFIRLLVFRQLGENFTFRLARPQRLVTTGLYGYVQHPSYPANWLVLMANFVLFARRDGVVGCVVPVRWAASGGAGEMVLWLVGMVLFAVLGLLGVWKRVVDEEEMMEKEFGVEWEAWRRRTWRFVPGVV